MEQPEEAGTYHIKNKGPVQGQNIGDGTTIHQYFGPVSTGAPLPAPVPVAPPQRIWNIPYPRNPFFTGHKDLLERLHTQLQTTSLNQPQAISGLGGIGKTQLAIEYAYRHRQDYHYVLWSQADTSEALIAGYVAIAMALQLQQKDEQDQTVTVQAVLQWLHTHQGWLLILDNADDLAVARAFLPSSFQGHLLLTTQAESFGGVAQRLEVDTLDQDMGALLLLRRAQIIAADAFLEHATPEQVTVARAITRELGGLPLALDQAGAYIEETQCELTNYQQRYQKQRAQLLARRGGVSEHPEPVATTWAISFKKVKQASPMAAQLLRFCAFLAPDAIPEELMVQALIRRTHSSKQTNNRWLDCSPLNLLHDKKQEEASLEELSWKLDDAVAVLRAYSLIQRKKNEKMLSVHRLVQVVMLDDMKKWEYKVWTTYLVCAVESLFPSGDFHSWELCARYLPQAVTCAKWVTQIPLIHPIGMSFLNRTGKYLLLRAQYQEAEPLLVQALAICEQQLGKKHPNTAACLNNLATLYDGQGRYTEAEPLLVRALAICEQQLGASDPTIARCLSSLAGLYKQQNRYVEAEPLLVRALAICEQQLGKDHPDTATQLHNLAHLYEGLERYAEAEPLLKQALEVSERQLGKDHPDTAKTLRVLAHVYCELGRYTLAEPLAQQALAVCEQVLGKEHPEVVRCLSTLGTLYFWQKKYAEAEPLYEQALTICEQQLGKKHPETATNMSNLARLYKNQGRYAEAEPMWKQTLAVREQHLGREHPATILCLDDLAMLYYTQGKYAEAEPLLKRSLTASEQALGRDHPRTQIRHRNYAILLQSTKSGGKQRKGQRIHKRFLM